MSLAILGAPTAAADPAPTPAAFVRDAVATPSQAGAYSGTVPDGVCGVQVLARGGAGGSSIANSTANTTPTNGGAAQITATYQVVAGQSFSGNVATGGAFAAVINQNPAGGVPGGGAGGATTATTTAHNGAGGGGYTDVTVGGQDLVVAAGGGGSGGGHSTVEGRGGDAGLPTGAGVTPGERGTNGIDNPTSNTSNGGGGGGAAAAGAGGINTGDAGRNGVAGSGRNGGRGGNDATPDAGGGGGAGYFGGGGGAGTVGNGSGAPTPTGIGGAGGGGGSSYVNPVSPDGSNVAASGISSVLGPTFGTGGNLPGANGALRLTWVTCDYDLGVTKSVTPTTAGVGDTVTWTVAVTNAGPDPMTLGDTVTLADTQTAGTTIASIATTGGSNTRGLARGAVTCSAAAGQAMPATLTCSRPFSAPDAPTSPTTGVRGLDPGETLTVTYTKTLAAGDVGTINNVASVTDRGATANNSDSATLTVTLPQPTARPDTSSGTQGAPQSVNPLTNDSPGSASTGSQFDPTTLTLLDGTTPVTSLTIPGQGTYTISRTDPANPRLVFTPLPTYAGIATPASYRIADNNGQTATSTYTPTVNQVARPDTATGPQGVPLAADVLANDNVAPGVTLVPSTLTLIGANGQPATTVSVTGGVYSIAAGQVVFTPTSTFTGTAPPVTYQVSDANGNPIQSTYTPTITPVTPTAADDTSSGPQGAPQSVDPFANDAPGNAGVPLDRPSLTLLNGAGAPVETLTVAGQGTYTVDRTDPANPRLQFQPLPGYVGTPTPADYRIADANGTTATASYEPSVLPVTRPDTSTGLQGRPQTTNVLANDTQNTPAGGGLDPTTLQLVDPADGVARDSVTVAGVGTYTVDDAGNVTFQPEPDYVGTPTALTYRVRDLDGNLLTSTYRPTVTPVTPIANPDTSTGPQGRPQSVLPLTNDRAGDASAPLVPSTLTLLDGTTAVDTLTVANQGTYTIDRTDPANPRIVFTPEATFAGAATPATYRIADANGTTATSTYTPSLAAVTPTGKPDFTTSSQGDLQVVNPFADNGAGADEPGDPVVPIVQSTLRFVDAAGNRIPDTLTIPGQGTYQINRVDPNNPRIEFQPLPDYVGTPTPVSYRFADQNGTLSDAVTYNPNVLAVTQPDTTTGLQGRPQTINVLANDDLHPPAGGGFNAATLQLIDPADNTAKDSVTVPDVGTYTVDDAGNVTFQPLPQYVGTPPALTYQVRDADNNVLIDTYTPTVTRVTPTASPDTSRGPQGVAQSVNPLTNDDPGDPTVPFDPTSLTLLDGSTPVATLEIPGQGTYSIDTTTDPANPRLVFTPLPTFVGTATPATYRVADVNGTTATSTYTPRLDAVSPVARPDETSGPQGALQRVNPFVDNGSGADTPGNAAVPINPSSLILLNAAGDPVDTVVVAGEGTYAVDRTDPVNPTITFQPLPTFSGAATPVDYRIADVNGTRAQSTYTPTVTPVTRPDTSTDVQGVPQTVDVLANDTQSAPGGGGFDPTSLQLIDPADNTAKDSVTIAGVGTYTVDDAGNVTFTPLPTYVGTPDPLTYQVRDLSGGTLRDTYTPTVTAIGPTANPDTTSGPQGVPQRVNPLLGNANGGADVPGDPRVPLDPTSLTLLDADGDPTDTVTVADGVYTIVRTGTGGPFIVFTPDLTFVGTATPVNYRIADTNGTSAQSTYTPTFTVVTPVASPDTTTGPQGALQRIDPFLNDTPGSPAVRFDRSTLTLLNGAGDPVETLVVAGQGTYAIDRSDPDNPTITFQPLPGFVGEADPVDYRVADANGTATSSTYTPTVTPVTRDDATTDVQGVAQTADVLANDTLDPTVTLVPSTLYLVDPVTGDPVQQVTVAGQGTYRVSNGRIVFTPLASFTGTATPVVYGVEDTDGNRLEATYTPTVTPLSPGANDDVTSGPQGLAQSIDPLANDSSGDPRVPLVPSTLTLLDADGDPTDQPVVIAGQGTYTIVNGRIVFTPEPDFVGTADPVSYQVADQNGTTVTATYTPTLTPVTPVANPDATSGPQGRPQRVSPLANDTAGNARVPLDPTSFTLLDAAGDPATSVTVAGQGTYTVDDSDPDNPVIVFTPLPGFVGTATPVTYRVADDNGTTTRSTYTPTLTAVAPRANPDRTSGPLNQPQSVDPLANDTVGSSAVPLDPSSLTLLDAAGDPATSVTIPGQGTYTIAGGRIVFTPVTGFFGTATPVTYRVADENGTTASSTYTPTIVPPDAEVVNVSASGQVGDPVTVNPLDENPDIDPGSIVLIGPDGELVTTLVVPGEGTWVVDPRTGDVTFTPEPGFTGDPTPVDYLAFEFDGTPVAGTLTITYERPDEPGPTEGPDLADTGAQVGLVGAGVVSLALIAGGITLVLRRRRGSDLDG